MSEWYRVIFVDEEGFIFDSPRKILAFAKAMHSLMYYADEVKPDIVDAEGVQFLMKGDWQTWLTRLKEDGVLEYFHVEVEKEEQVVDKD